MSSLAFDKQGKPFAFQPQTRKLLVRLFRNPAKRGTCCAVLDADGEQLYLDVDADYQDLRRAVGNVPGLYRLDQCDESDTEIAGAQAAYVSIESTRNLASLGELDARDALIRELAHMNADMAKTAIAQNASMMQAAADVLRAYLPHPPPPPPPPSPLPPPAISEPDDDDDGDDDDGDDGDELDEPGPMAELLRQLSPFLATIGAAAAQGVIEVVRRFFESRASSTAPSAAHATGELRPPGGQSPEPPSSRDTRDTAAASRINPDARNEHAGDTASNRSNTSEPVDTQSASIPAPVITVPAADEVASVARDASHDGPNPVPKSADGRTPARNASPTLTPEQAGHLFAIRARLTPKEAKIAETAIARMPPDVLAQWMTELSSLTIDDAVRVVRNVIADARPDGGPERH